tara:strand:+ start:142 stop:342 length:201 start_codon:yes stop_codon:yes gene_type:complete
MMTYHTEELIKKVVMWRFVSITVTLILTYLYTGSIKEATFSTVVLHMTLIIAHYLFERWWERRDNL